MTVKQYLESDDKYAAAQELAVAIANETGCPLQIGMTYLSDWIYDGDIQPSDTFESIAIEWIE